MWKIGVLLVFNPAPMLDECSCGSDCQECDECYLPECECDCDDDETDMPEGVEEDDGADEVEEDEDLDDQDDEVDDDDDEEEDDEGF